MGLHTSQPLPLWWQVWDQQIDWWIVICIFLKCNPTPHAPTPIFIGLKKDGGYRAPINFAPPRSWCNRPLSLPKSECVLRSLMSLFRLAVSYSSVRTSQTPLFIYLLPYSHTVWTSPSVWHVHFLTPKRQKQGGGGSITMSARFLKHFFFLKRYTCIFDRLHLHTLQMELTIVISGSWLWDISKWLCVKSREDISKRMLLLWHFNSDMAKPVAGVTWMRAQEVALSFNNSLSRDFCFPGVYVVLLNHDIILNRRQSQNCFVFF